MRNVIHYTKGCPHTQDLLHDVRLAYQWGKLSGDFDEMFGKVRAFTQELSSADRLRLQFYLRSGAWFAGNASADTNSVCQFLSDSAARLCREDQPELAAEFLGQEIVLRALDGDIAIGDQLIEDFFTKCPEMPGTRVIYEVAFAHLLYASDGPRYALPALTRARDHAAQHESPCMIEVATVPLALMYAAWGEYDDAVMQLQRANLPLERMDPFWDPAHPEALSATLRWYEFVAAKLA